MGNLFEDLDVPVSNGVGAASDTSGMGNPKTIEVVGSFSGSIIVEASLDEGATWAAVWVFTTDPAKKVLSFAANRVRLRRANVSGLGGTPSASISANDFGALFAALPSNISVDTSALGSDKTVTVQDLPLGGTVNIEVSEDSINWATCMTFKGNDVKSRVFTAKFMRAFGSIAIVNVGAVNDGDGSTELIFSAPVTVRGANNVEGISTEILRADNQRRLEYEVEDEGVLVSARPRMDFVGDGVGAIDVPGEDLTRVTIPGPNLGDGGAVVKRSTYVAIPTSTSSLIYVDGMSGGFVTVPIDGDYWVIFEGEGENQSNGIQIQIGISVNSLVAVVAASERKSRGNASDLRSIVTTVQLPGLIAGDLIRCLYKRIGGGGPQMVAMERRHLSIFKVQ